MNHRCLLVPLLLALATVPPALAVGPSEGAGMRDVPVCVRQDPNVPPVVVTVGQPCGPPVVTVEKDGDRTIVTVCVPLGPFGTLCRVYVVRCDDVPLVGERVCWSSTHSHIPIVDDVIGRD